jgi:hypothetical protein
MATPGTLAIGAIGFSISAVVTFLWLRFPRFSRWTAILAALAVLGSAAWAYKPEAWLPIALSLWRDIEPLLSGPVVFVTAAVLGWLVAWKRNGRGREHG